MSLNPIDLRTWDLFWRIRRKLSFLINFRISKWINFEITCKIWIYLVLPLPDYFFREFSFARSVLDAPRWFWIVQIEFEDDLGRCTLWTFVASFWGTVTGNWSCFTWRVWVVVVVSYHESWSCWEEALENSLMIRGIQNFAVLRIIRLKLIVIILRLLLSINKNAKILSEFL